MMDFTSRVRMPMKDPIDTWREDNGKSILFPTGADAAGGHCFVDASIYIYSHLHYWSAHLLKSPRLVTAISTTTEVLKKTSQIPKVNDIFEGEK